MKKVIPDDYIPSIPDSSHIGPVVVKPARLAKIPFEQKEDIVEINFRQEVISSVIDRTFLKLEELVKEALRKKGFEFSSKEELERFAVERITSFRVSHDDFTRLYVDDVHICSFKYPSPDDININNLNGSCNITTTFNFIEAP